MLESAGGLTIQDVSREGRWLATRDDLRTGFLVKAPGEKEERDLSWLGNSLAPILSRDGKTLLFTDESESAGANYMACHDDYKSYAYSYGYQLSHLFLVEGAG